MPTLTPADLAAAIDTAFQEVWQFHKGFPVPASDPTDRQILFLAIARGVLKYLADNQNAVINSITLNEGSDTNVSYGVPALGLNISIPENN
jgi:hypothetical protein